MDFLDVCDVLTEGSGGMTQLPLKLLQPDRDAYTCLLIQPTGSLEYSETRIGYVDSLSATNSFSALFGEASCDQINLVVAPEYSTPWGFVRSISLDENRPDIGNIWVLGCESILPSDLVILEQELVSKGLKVFYEELNQVDKNFLCPLLYVFWVKGNDGEEKLFALFQFKTTPLGGTDIERLNLVQGSKIYKPRFKFEVHHFNR